MIQGGLWDPGSPPAGRIFAGPIGCRCRHSAVTSHRKRQAALFSRCLELRSAVRGSRYFSPNAQLSAGRNCGSGFHCQHRCCHCPRLPSFAGGEPQRQWHRKVARRSTESAAPTLRFNARRCQAFSTRERLKTARRLEPASRCQRLIFRWLVEISNAGP